MDIAGAAYTGGVLAVQRTHRLRADLAWVPGPARRASRLARGLVWAGTGAAIAGTVALAPWTVVMWKAFLLGGAGAVAAGDGAGKAVLRRQLQRLSRGELPLAELDARPEGELVVVRGTIEAAAPLHGTLVETPGVYRRLVLAARGTWVHEAAVDFALVDAHGTRILVQAAGARWLVPGREMVEYPAGRFREAGLPPLLAARVAARETVEAYERVLPVGAAVQLVGYKTASPDATGTVRDYRLPPERATLCSGPDLPLVITALSDLAP